MLASSSIHATHATLKAALPTQKAQQGCTWRRVACDSPFPQSRSARAHLLRAAAVRTKKTKKTPLPADLEDEFDIPEPLPEQEPQEDTDPTEEEKKEENLGLVPNKEGYQAIKLDGCEFLLATNSDGSLDLSDAYVQDDESGIYAEPDVTGGDIPSTAQQYSQVEWSLEDLGDIVFDKPPRILVKRVYLIHITQLEPRQVDLTDVWVLDSETRSIYCAQVDRITESQDPAEIMLRIRRDGSLLIDSAQVMPTPDELILQEEYGEQPGEASPVQRWRMDDPDEDISDPIDAIEDDFDEPDVPAVDLA